MTPKERAAHTRSIAAEFSADAPRETVEDRIVNALHRDIADRCGIKWEWEKIDDETKAELLETWREIIRQELNAGTNS